MTDEEQAAREYELSKYSRYELIKELHERGTDLSKLVATFTYLAKEDGSDRYYPTTDVVERLMDGIARWDEATQTWIADSGKRFDENGKHISEGAAYRRATGGV